MDTYGIDEELREFCERNSPPFDEAAFSDRLRRRTSASHRHASAPGRKTGLRIAAVAFSALVLLAVVGTGIFEAVRHLGEPAKIVVISDETSLLPSTEVGGTAGIHDSQIDLGPANQIKFADAWRQIVKREGLDVLATPSEDFSLEFSPSGAFVAMTIRIPLSGWDLVASWDGRGGAADQRVVASIRTTEIPGQQGYLTVHGLYYQLAKIDEVGVARILAMLPKPGSDGYYRVGQWEPQDKIISGSNGPKGYVWAGASFEPVDQWMKKLKPIEISFAQIEGMALSPGPSDAVYLQFVLNPGIALPTSTVTTGAAPEFADLMDAWATRMITPISVGRDPSEPNATFVKLSADVLAPPDGVLVSALLVHEAFLAVHQHHLPVDKLTIYSVAADGVESVHEAVSLQSSMKFAPGWSVADTAVEASFGDGEKATQAASGGTYAMNSAAEWDGDGRQLRVSARLSADNALENYTRYLTELVSALEQLNREGTRVALLQLSVDDAEGNPVLRDVHDFQLGSTSTWYEGPDYMPPWPR